MDCAQRKTADQQIRTVTNLGIVVNVGLSVVKFVVGFLGGSISLVADGIHSLSDMTTDLAVLLGVHLGAKKADASHPYGHGRAETFAAGFIAVVLAGVGSAMIYHAVVEMTHGHKRALGVSVLVVGVTSIAAKEIIYRMTRRVAIGTHSSALYANAWHHRSDALSSIAVVIGVVVFRLGFSYADQVAAMAVGLMVVLVGIHVLIDCLRELTEGAVDSETIEHIKEIINANSAIRQWHRLRSRTVGREVFLDLHILVDPKLNVSAAHEIAESLERTLEEEVSRPVNVTVHIEPDVPELRR